MITKYRPDLEGYVSTNQPGATGDGYAMAEAVGAQLIQMDQIQIHPTVEQQLFYADCRGPARWRRNSGQL